MATAPDVSNQRLSFPVTYWNTLGLLAALGIVLAFHLSARLPNAGSRRILAAGVIPLLAATLFFTFSRGAISAGAIGLALYVLVARPRGLLGGGDRHVPATACCSWSPTRPICWTRWTRPHPRPSLKATTSRSSPGCACSRAAPCVCSSHLLDPRLHRVAPAPIPAVQASTRRAAIAGGLCAVVALGDRARRSPRGRKRVESLHRRRPHPRRTRPAPAVDRPVQRWAHRPVAGRVERVRPRPRCTATARDVPDVVGSRPSRISSTRSTPTACILQAMAELGVPGLALLVVLVGVILGGLASRARSGVRGGRVWRACSPAPWCGRCARALTGTGRCPSSPSRSSPPRVSP